MVTVALDGARQRSTFLVNPEPAGGAKVGGAAMFGAASKAEEHHRPLKDDQGVVVAIVQNRLLNLVHGGYTGCVETEIAGGTIVTESIAVSSAGSTGVELAVSLWDERKRVLRVHQVILLLHW
ncbi:hypothetical protein U1Q18_012829 [Sarracenia purpurea var. burkii]